MAMAMLNALTFVISVEVYLWFCLVLGCVVGEVYPCEVGNNYTRRKLLLSACLLEPLVDATGSKYLIRPL